MSAREFRTLNRVKLLPRSMNHERHLRDRGLNMGPDKGNGNGTRRPAKHPKPDIKNRRLKNRSVTRQSKTQVPINVAMP